MGMEFGSIYTSSEEQSAHSFVNMRAYIYQLLRQRRGSTESLDHLHGRPDPGMDFVQDFFCFGIDDLYLVMGEEGQVLRKPRDILQCCG